MNAPLRVLPAPPTTRAEAEAIAGTLSSPEKMPCKAYSIPAQACNVGAQLYFVEGSVCSDCYALKGRYRTRPVQDAMNRRLASLTHPYWVEAMVILIRETKNDYFRWHDSGDLQSLQHLLNIVEIARRLPHVRFWLPTREVGLVRKYERAFGSFPANLVVRVSAAMIDGPPPAAFDHTSTVVNEWPDCPAPTQGNKCKDCRRCWDPGVKNVAYLAH